MKQNSIKRFAPIWSQDVMALVFRTGLLLGLLLVPAQSFPAGFSSPEECLAYSGDAHLNCLYAYIEIQQEEISKLKKKLSGQEIERQELQGKLKQQRVRAHALERKMADHENQSKKDQYRFIRPYGGYYYWYGSPYYYDPYFGPPFGYPYWP